MATKSVSQIARELDALGWATTVPDADDCWTATAWPPLTQAGIPDHRSDRTVHRLQRAGQLGLAARDDEGHIYYPILGIPESSVPVDSAVIADSDVCL